MIRFGGYLRGARAGLTARVIVIFVLLPFVQARAAEHSIETNDLIAPIVVDSKSSSPINSPDVFVAGSMYRLIVTGTYSANGLPADAECSGNPPTRTTTSWTDTNGTQHDLYDLEINGRDVAWKVMPVGSDLVDELGCSSDTSRAYYVDVSIVLASESIDTEAGSVDARSVCDSLSDDRYCFQPRRLKLGINMASKADSPGNHTLNTGKLYVYPVCQFFNSAYIEQAASNDNDEVIETAEPAAGCPNGASFTNSQYPCPRGYHDKDKEKFLRYGILTSATVLIDSRTNEFDPILRSDPYFGERNYTSTDSYYATTTSTTEENKFRQSGHWGITTCNLAGVGVPYRITVIGKYKFDQTQPLGYAEADAECATGYPDSTSTVKDHNNDPVTNAYAPSRRSVVTEASEDPGRAARDRANETGIGVSRSMQAIAPDIWGALPWDSIPEPAKGMVPRANQTIEAKWLDEFIPAYYNYFFQLLKSGRLAGPQEARPWTDDALPATWDYTEYVYATHNSQAFVSEGPEFDLYGADWRPKRFEYMVTQTGSGGEPSGEVVDAFDLRVNYAGAAERFIDWTPLKRLGDRNYVPDLDNECSAVHAYYFDVDWSDPTQYVLVPNAPIHFKIHDVLAYNEWDNCGILSINVRASQDGFNVKDVPDNLDLTPDELSDKKWTAYKCNFVTQDLHGATRIRIRDLRIDDRNLANLQTTHAYYFDPTTTVVTEKRFFATGEKDKCSQPQGRCGEEIPNTVVWENFGAGPHSITAAVDKEGRFCKGVVTYATKALGRSASTPTTVGADECDDKSRWASERMGRLGAGRQRLFDFFPGCLGDIDRILKSWTADPTLCTAPYDPLGLLGRLNEQLDKTSEGIQSPDVPGQLSEALDRRVSNAAAWKIELTQEFKSNGSCKNVGGTNFCTIPYFCRVAPEIMRGNLVVRLDP